MIGDGMGAQQIGLLEMYATLAPESIYKARGRTTGMRKFMQAGQLGLSMTEPADALVVDSACSATQLATGLPSRNGLIGIDSNGNREATVLELAKATGKSTGLVSDTRISHATPAAFASHQTSRKLENAIAEEMLSDGNVDVMLSGGLRHWLPASTEGAKSEPELDIDDQLKLAESGISLTSRRQDHKNLLADAAQAGYQLAFTAAQLRAAAGPKVLGLFASSAMLDGISSHQISTDDRIQPTLADMSKAALKVLDKNPEGFFLMIEGGQIDWAGHNNDAGSLLHEMVKFDEAIEQVYQWAKDRKDTLVIITGDHETGGFAFSYSRKNIPPGELLQGDAFKGSLYRPPFNYGSADLLDKLYAQSASFPLIWNEARGSQHIATAGKVMQSLNKHSAFTISLQQALDIVQREANEYYVKGGGYLDAKTTPKIHDFKEFYVYGDEIHYDLMGRALAADQNVVWATGTHTATPVPYVVWGAEQTRNLFTPLTHHRDIGEALKSIIAE